MDDDLNNDQLEIELPIYVELKQSQYSTNDLGAYSRMQLNADQFIGNYKGKTKKSMSQCADPNYVWTILSSRQIPLFYIDATDPKDSNWLRFIRSTSDITKYNVICMQQNQQINYFTFKEIKLGEELVTYLPGKKKKPKNKAYQNLTYRLVTDQPSLHSSLSSSSTSSMSEAQKQTNNRNTDSPLQSDEANSNDQLEKPDQEAFGSNEQLEVVSKQLDDKTETSIIDSNNKDDQTLQQHQQSKQQQKENENLIDIKILTQDISKCDDYFFNFDFTLKINNLRKLKRRLIKCDLCSHTIIADSNGDDTLIKLHIINEHLALKDPNESLETVLTDLIDSIIRKIENSDNNDQLIDSKYSFKCIYEDELFNSKLELDNHLNKHHLDSLVKLKCFYCTKYFDSQKDSLKDYLNHLSSDHKEDIIQDQLVSAGCNDEQNVSQINWDEYFKDESSLDDAGSDSNDLPKQNKPLKTWTCQMCKKQFDQRIDLSKHECIELNLRLLKKKKELRKKKWREAHWKRKIDLSYIETTSLTQMSHKIADNLSFCIDGTQEDLKAYSREVRDYLSTELGHESQIQMFLKCCFPDLYQSIINQISNLTESNAGQLVDSNIFKRAISYFIESDFKSNLNCKNCKAKFSKLSELIQHQRSQHGLNLKTSFENYKSSQLNNSPIGYLSCDPFAYLLNLHWDKQCKLKCFNCNNQFQRVEYKKHVTECHPKSKQVEELAESNQTVQPEQVEEGEEEIIIFSARTDNYTEAPKELKAEPVIETSKEEPDVIELKAVAKIEEKDDNESTFKIISELLEDLIDQIENIKEEKTEINSSGASTINSNTLSSSQSRRRKRTAQELLEDQLGCSSNIILNKKRTIQNVKNDQFVYFNTQHHQQSSSPQSSSPQAQIQTRKSVRSSSSVCSTDSQQSQSSPTKSVTTPIKSRISPRNTQQKLEIIRPGLRSSRSSTNSSLSNSPVKTEKTESSPKSESKTNLKTENLITVRMVNNRKMHTCEKCGLEFTSGNSVLRHQEKSCLRVKVITINTNLNSASSQNSKNQTIKKRCPICSSVFYNTHRLSIHIYRHHKNLLGSAHDPVLPEAKRLNEIQILKTSKMEADGVEDEEECDQDELIDDEEGLDYSLEEHDVSINSENLDNSKEKKGKNTAAIKEDSNLIITSDKLNSTI